MTNLTDNPEPVARIANAAGCLDFGVPAPAFVYDNDPENVEGVNMIRVDGFWLYQLAANISRLAALAHESTKKDIRLALYQGVTWVNALLNNSIFRIKTSRPKGTQLLEQINALQTKLQGLSTEELDKPIDFMDAWVIRSTASEFQTLLSAELQFVDLYYVTAKGGFDTTAMAENGEVIFPGELRAKVPESIPDAKQAARCLAFELPTAAGFHLHRVNEAVLHRYYDQVTNGDSRPENRSMGVYINELESKGAGDGKVIAALKSLKDLHRNPLMHPEESLDSVDEALALHGAIHSVMVHMLKVLPISP